MEHKKLQKDESQAKQQELNLTGIPTQMKWDLEARSGLSLDDVRVHYHSDKPAKLGALAYTQGTQVHIGPGQEGHLRHELGHVVQQKLGLVRPNAWYPGGLALNTEEALEQQADAIGTGSYCQPPLSAGIPPVQRFEDPVVQAAGHIENVGNVIPSADILSLPDAPGPTIVFETMGATAKNCEEVYKQTTQLYGSNTICVFGLNAKTGDESTFNEQEKHLKKLQEDVKNGAVQQGAVQQGAGKKGAGKKGAGKKGAGKKGAVQQGAADQGAFQHLLYTFSFKWTEIKEKNKGYSMPFVEARVLVMQKASEIVDKLQGSGGNSQYKFLYRWIDADARDDKTSFLAASRLNALVEKDKKGEAAVMTGRYDWRSKATDHNKIPKYKEFIDQFNQAEKILREYYDDLSRRSWGDDQGQEIASLDDNVDGISQRNSEAATLAAIKNNGYLPGYYYPESTLLMNQTAHTRILKSFPPVGDSPDEILSKIGVSANCPAQDKESMRLLGLPDLSPQIDFNPELSVTKPLKKEFADGSYWGKDMLAFLRDPQDWAAFIVALKNVRQSAFNPGLWYFTTMDPWDKWENPNQNIENSVEEKQELFNQKRRELANDLFITLAGKGGRGGTMKKIAEEIKKLSTITQKSSET